MLNCNDCFYITGNILPNYSLFIWWVCSSPFCTVVIYTSVKQGCSELSMWLAVSELIVTHIIWVYSAHGQMLYNTMASETQNLCYLEWSQTIVMDLKTIHMTINERINNAALYWWYSNLAWKIKFCYKTQALTLVIYPTFKDASFALSLKICPNLSKTLLFSEFLEAVIHVSEPLTWILFQCPFLRTA